MALRSDFGSVIQEHEAGIIQWMLHADPHDADAVILYARYSSEETFAEHLANHGRVPAYGELRAKLGPVMDGGPYDSERLELLAGFARPEAADPAPIKYALWWANAEGPVWRPGLRSFEPQGAG